MGIRAALLCAALVAAPLRAQDTPVRPALADARAVLSAVLAQEAAVRGPEGGAETCVAGALTGPPAAPGAEDPMVPTHAVRIVFEWHVPPPPAAARPAPAPPAPGRRAHQRRSEPVPAPLALTAALADRLNAARAEAARAPAIAGIARIDAPMVPAPLYLQGQDENCAQLSLSAPAFAGEVAFVELGYACGGPCGTGSLYALQRVSGRWEVIGIADIWIS